MDTILIMARALSKASYRHITRLDIQFNIISDMYIGTVTLEYPDDESKSLLFKIWEDGSVSKISQDAI